MVFTSIFFFFFLNRPLKITDIYIYSQHIPFKASRQSSQSFGAGIGDWKVKQEEVPVSEGAEVVRIPNEADFLAVYSTTLGLNYIFLIHYLRCNNLSMIFYLFSP